MSIVRITLLVSVWCVLTRELTILNILLGLGLSMLLLRVMGDSDREQNSILVRKDQKVSRRVTAGVRIFLRPIRALDLTAFFLYELVLSNVRMALMIVNPMIKVKSTVIEIPVEVESEEELALLSDLVTLTPGTLTLDVTDDGRTLYVHVLSTEDPREVRQSIRQGLARRVRRLFE